MYPPEMELGKENVDCIKGSFLDLDICIENKKIEVTLFDKNDAFPFNIVRMPYSSSNMPSTIFYSSIGADVLRIAITTSNIAPLVSSYKKPLSRMFKQGALVPKVHSVLKKLFGRHQDDFLHSCKSANEFCNLLCSS